MFLSHRKTISLVCAGRGMRVRKYLKYQELIWTSAFGCSVAHSRLLDFSAVGGKNEKCSVGRYVNDIGSAGRLWRRNSK
jgi:hypothetical protein